MELSDATEELVRQVSAIPQELGAGACFGDPVERDGHTLIPVARVNFGYGLGFGGGSSSNVSPSSDGTEDESKSEGGGGGGGGGGGSSTPVAVIDISASGVRIEPIEDKTRLALASSMMVAWIVFWVFWTARTLVHERARVRRLEIEKSS